MNSEEQDRLADTPLTLNPLIGVSVEDLAASAAKVLRQAALQPNVAAEYWFRLQAELARALLNRNGQPVKDKRFADEAFTGNRFFGGLAQAWQAWQRTTLAWTDAAGFDGVDKDRARFIIELITDAFAPTNFLLGNPSALRKVRDSNGKSLIEGARHFFHDLLNNGGMPSQVDQSAFKVGENLAITPGAVVYREDIFELIQYQPNSGRVSGTPVFIVPPQVNKYYIYDLSPEKSLLRFLVEQDQQVFVLSWRNPTKEHRDWTLANYVDGVERAMDVAREVSGATQLHTVGACAGGITLATTLSYLAQRGKLDGVASLTLMVNVLQPHNDDSVIGLFSSDAGIEKARQRSERDGVLDGAAMARMFNWMRPNDLIWNYVVSNYLHGESPPAFDILYWNNDTTNLPARLHSDFLDLFKGDLLAKQGALKIHDIPIDLHKVSVPTFITGGTTDHITPWQACYRSTQLLGGECTYILSTAGHIQSFINPPGSSKRKYYTNASTPPSAQDWLSAADEHSGSWWPYWVEWLDKHRNAAGDASPVLGSALHPVLCAAPGTYVHEKAK